MKDFIPFFDYACKGIFTTISMELKEAVMTGNRNNGTPGGTGEGRHKERRFSGGFLKTDVFGKCLIGAALVFAEWKLGSGERPMDVRLQELAFLLVLCQVAFCDVRTGMIPDRFVGEIFALASAGFL